MLQSYRWRIQEVKREHAKGRSVGKKEERGNRGKIGRDFNAWTVEVRRREME